MNCFRAVKIVGIARIQKVYRCYAIGIFLCSLVCHTHIALFLLIKLVVARTVRSINQLRQFYFCSVTTNAFSMTEFPKTNGDNFYSLLYKECHEHLVL